MLRPQTCTRIIILFGIFILVMFFAQMSFAQSDQSRPRPSPADCDAYARNYVESTSGGMLGGAARGAVGGGLFGAVIGGGKGAGRGAALGAVVGGTKRAVDRDRAHRQAYDDCMAGRVRW